VTVIDSWAEFLERWNDGHTTPQELTDWKLSSLNTVLRHVYDKSPFYRRHFAGVDLSIADLSELSRLPFTTKDDLRSAMHDMLCGNISEAQYYFETTGTTGRPTPCPRAPIDFKLNWLPFAHALKRITGKHFADDSPRPVLAVVAPNDCHSACLSLSFAAQHVGVTKLDLFPISPTLGFSRFFEVLAELRVNMLYCSPGLLMAIAEMSSSYGFEVPDDLNVKVLLTTGEMCSDSMQKALAHTWKADVYNLNYGSQEAGAPSLARLDGAQIVVEPTYLLEVIELESDVSLGFEGFGELCITSLVPGLKPLIRYRTGELVEIKATADGLRAMQVLGRTKDMTEIGGRKRSAAQIDNAALVDPTLIFGYEIEVHAENGDDRLLIRIKAKEGADHGEIKRLVAGSVTDAFDVPVDVLIHPLLDLKSTTGGWVSWKTARIKDLRSAPDPDIESESADLLVRAAERAI
jgi:phenylacetate-CoA ligase